MKGDENKWAYAIKAAGGTDPFSVPAKIEAEIREVGGTCLGSPPPIVRTTLLSALKAINWEAELTEDQVVQRREAMIAKLEEADSHMRRSELAVDWFTEVDSGVRGVAGAVNGELLEQLATLTEFRDKGAVECLRKCLPISI